MGGMFQRLLVALDGSEISQLVYEQAIVMATALKAELMFLHVLSEDDRAAPQLPQYPYLSYYPGISDKLIDLYREQWETLQARGLEMLRSQTARATAAGLSAEYTQVQGSPGRIICQLAESWGADLVVMGRRGRTGLSELLLGSVSNYVIHHVLCSTLVVQPSTPGISVIKTPMNAANDRVQEHISTEIRSNG
jgi:nucleotide-binding universal stress UspA family protein